MEIPYTRVVDVCVPGTAGSTRRRCLRPCPPDVDLRLHLCLELNLGQTVADRHSEIEIWCSDAGGPKRQWDPKRRELDPVDLTRTAYELRLPSDLRQDDDDEGTTDDAPPAEVCWLRSGCEWHPSVNFVGHPLAKSWPAIRACDFRARTLRDPPAGKPQLHLNTEYAVGSRQYQKAMWDHLEKLRPHFEFTPEMQQRSACVPETLLGYMDCLPLVVEIEMFGGRDANLTLLLATSKSNGARDDEAGRSSASSLFGYVVDHNFTRELALQELSSRGLLGDPSPEGKQQLVLVSDIDHTILHAKQVADPRLVEALPKEPYHLLSWREADRWAEVMNGCPDFSIHFHDEASGSSYTHVVAVREGLESLLHLVKDGLYQLVFMTAGSRSYASAVLQALVRFLEDRNRRQCLADSDPALMEAARAACSLGNSVSVQHIQVWMGRRRESICDPSAGPKSFKQQFVFASFEEFNSKILVGVDDSVAEIGPEVPGGCAKWTSNYDRCHVDQIVRIRRQRGAESRGRETPAWSVAYASLLRIHEKVTDGSMTVQEAVACCRRQSHA